MKARGETVVERVVWAGLFTPAPGGRMGLPYCLVGKPGVGKTSRINSIARQAGLHFESVVASLRDPTDFVGLPSPGRMVLTPATQHLAPDGDADIPVMNYAAPGFGLRAAARRQSLILLDEVNTAPPSVQAALLRALFEGVLGELQLPPEVRFILAMNAVEDAAGGWDIAPPLANRVGWLKWEPPSTQRFSAFLMHSASDEQEVPVAPRAEATGVLAAWPAEWAKVTGQGAGFLTSRPELLFRMPPSGSEQASAAWPSPRSWELALRAVAGARVYGLTPVEEATAMAAFIGDGAVGEFRDWLRDADLPDPAEVLDGHVQFEHQPRRLDRTAAFIASATALVLGDADSKTTPKGKAAPRVDALWKVHQTLADQAPDLALGSVAALCRARLMLGSQVAYKVLAKMEPVMSASGVTPGGAP